MSEPFELPPPSEETQALLNTMATTPSLQPADAKFVRFYSRSKKDEAKTAAEGRPIFEAREYVEIFAPGDKDTVVDRPVRELDKYVWPERYLAFRRGLSQESAGTPLTAWAGVSNERAMEYAHFKIRTVDQLAEVPDGNLQNLGLHARAEREKARAYLAIMKGNAPVAELKAENEALKARLDALEKLATMSQPEKSDKPQQPRK
jgi:hypothetical protein